MRTSKKEWLALSVLLVALSGSLPKPALAGNAEAARAKVQTLCENCHGKDGVAVLPGAANL